MPARRGNGDHEEDIPSNLARETATALGKMMVKIVADEERLFALDARFEEWRTAFTKRFEETMTAREKALEIQADEYERRLEALNGEAGRIKDILDSSVTKETFLKSEENDKLWKERIQDDIIGRDVYEKFIDGDRAWKAMMDRDIVRRPEWEKAEEQNRLWQREVRTILDRDDGRKAGVTARNSLWIALAGIAMGLVSLLLKFIGP